MPRYDFEDDERSGAAKCCDRWPWPSVLSTILMIGSIILFCVSLHYATEDTERLFRGTAAEYQIKRTIYWAQIGIYCLTGLMLFISFILLSLGCLATGSYRKEHVCRFPNRGCGVCQMIVFGFVAYILFLGWVAVVAICVIPLWFFSIVRSTHCGIPGGCIDLRQFGLTPMTTPDDMAKVCGTQLVLICEKNPWGKYLMGTIAAVACLLVMAHYLMIFAANYAHVKDNYRQPSFTQGRNQNQSGFYKPTRSPNQQYGPDIIGMEDQPDGYMTGMSTRTRSRDPIGYTSNSKDPLSYQM
ncbi:neuronal membrane glycoprotein M6-b-like [Ptychodera flava]|uniref:neuronal membrane glycoprotein M6-b-like n=1 Tax=Ptychodera flava TaxID=63121 RepID=UPI00396A9B8A